MRMALTILSSLTLPFISYPCRLVTRPTWTTWITLTIIVSPTTNEIILTAQPPSDWQSGTWLWPPPGFNFYRLLTTLRVCYTVLFHAQPGSPPILSWYQARSDLYFNLKILQIIRNNVLFIYLTSDRPSSIWQFFYRSCLHTPGVPHSAYPHTYAIHSSIVNSPLLHSKPTKVAGAIALKARDGVNARFYANAAVLLFKGSPWH